MKLHFHAATVDVDPDAERISFSDEGDRSYFVLQRDEERADEVLPDLDNVWVERDDQAHGGRGGLKQVTLEPGVFRAEIDTTLAPFFAPYDAVEITFDAEDEDDLEAIAETLPRLLRGYLDRLRMNLPERPAPVVQRAPPKKGAAGKASAPAKASGPAKVSGPPRRKGPAVLSANVPKSARWSASEGADVELVIIVESHGGPLEKGVRIELGGAAITSGVIEPVEASNPGVPARPFERQGDQARVELPELRLEADLEPEPNARRTPGSSPVTRITLRARAKSAGKQLLTVRVTPRTSRDREGSAMVGRTFVVEP